MRYFIKFSYYGKPYHGWQNQPNAITVQQVLEEAIATLLREPVLLTAAGRTDAGVHAKQMYAHFEIALIENDNDLVYKLNSLLPDDIAVQKIFKVHKDAHARFNAIERTYEYVITQEKNPFTIESAHYVRHSLDIVKMNQAAEILLGYKDFECFSKTNTDVHTYFCDIKRAKWTKTKDLLIFTITADRFLRNMVRAIVGTLLEVGMGKCTVDQVKAIINSKDRSNAGVSVPAKGLYLMSILYPKNIVK